MTHHIDWVTEEKNRADALVKAAEERRAWGAEGRRPKSSTKAWWGASVAMLLVVFGPYLFALYGAGAVVVMGIVIVFGGVSLVATFYGPVANQPPQKS